MHKHNFIVKLGHGVVSDAGELHSPICLETPRIQQEGADFQKEC